MAVFIDFENIQYSYHNLYGASPDPQELIRIAQRYGIIVHATAFADFVSQPHLSKMMAQLRTASIECIDVPAERRGHRVKDYADFAMLEDIYQTYLDRDDVKTFVLMTGDGHFATTVARLRVRFQKDVIVVAVKGSVSQDLRASASSVIELEGPATKPIQEPEVLRAIDYGERTLPFVGLSQFVKYFSGSSGASPADVHRTVERFLAEGSVQEYSQDYNGYATRAIRLVRTHPKVVEHLRETAPPAQASGAQAAGTEPSPAATPLPASREVEQ